MKFKLGQDFSCDLGVLVDTRMLVQCNSGGGKSHTLRRLLEQTHGHVQQLVLDPEGEFASLRERHDYVLAAKSGGDTAADPRSAKLLAERLLELGVSAILDVYELKAHERIRFVRVFLEALIDAPKKLWHPVLVVIDEAHVYCPQKGEAESAGAVIDLATRGRKRGFCAVLATQRLSKLHKDAAAELNNKLIGRTGLDVDMQRAAEELGFTGRDERLQLRALDPGEFFAFGPALSPTVTRVMIGPVQTTHPKAGARLATIAPPPTEKVKALLPKLADLPAEAAEQQRSEAELKRELAAARATITRLEHTAPTRVATKVETKIERVEVPVLKNGHAAALERTSLRLEKLAIGLQPLVQNLGAIASTIRDTLRASQRPPAPTAQSSRAQPARMQDPRAVSRSRHEQSVAPSGEPLPRGERRVLIAIAQHPAGVSRKQLSVLTGYRRSTRDTYVQRLTERGLVVLSGPGIQATDAGIQALGEAFEPLPIGSALLEHWRGRLPEGERRILEVLVETWPEAVPREAISEATGYARSSRDTYLQRLSARKLVELEGRGAVRASEMLFERVPR